MTKPGRKKIFEQASRNFGFTTPLPLEVIVWIFKKPNIAVWIRTMIMRDYKKELKKCTTE